MCTKKKKQMNTETDKIMKTELFLKSEIEFIVLLLYI